MNETALSEAPRLLDVIRPEGAGLHVKKVLSAVRSHLRMDIGFVSEFVDGRRVFRTVDSDLFSAPIAVGGSDPLEEGYCQRVVDGRLPELMTNALDFPEAAAMPVTSALPVGAHVSVPIVLPDGRLYGTFCCFSFKPDTSLGDRDLQVLRAFAAIVADLIYTELQGEQQRTIKLARISAMIEQQNFDIVYQPIFRLRDDSLAAFEALTRFKSDPVRSPDEWFREAADIGLSAELEFATIRAACRVLPDLPSDVALTLNLSPTSVLKDEFRSLFMSLPLQRLVLEVTEHEAVANYVVLAEALQSFRNLGLRLAVDDAGAGHSSFRHVLTLRPDIIKLDMSLTRDIDQDAGRRALATALTTFGHAIGSQIVAEGVETAGELATLREIGVTKVQGYLLAKPLARTAALALARAALGAPQMEGRAYSAGRDGALCRPAALGQESLPAPQQIANAALK